MLRKLTPNREISESYLTDRETELPTASMWDFP